MPASRPALSGQRSLETDDRRFEEGMKPAALPGRCRATIKKMTRRSISGSGLAGAAIVLAVIGIYGLVSQGVAERWRELGIRRALGASTQRIVGDVALQGLALAAAGIAVGLGVAAVAAPLLRQVVWGVPLLDPWTFLAASGTLLEAGAVASLVPAIRVAAIDPSRVLRWE